MGLQATVHQSTTPPMTDRIPTVLKRKMGEDDLDIPTKKLCIENADAGKEDAGDSRPPSAAFEEESLMIPACAVVVANSNDEENKENHESSNTSSDNLDSILSKTLQVSHNNNNVNNNNAKDTTSNTFHNSATTSTSVQSATTTLTTTTNSPKVIVEHQPLPSIYELQQISGCDSMDTDNFDSGLSDESGSDPESDEDYDLIPKDNLKKALYNDRFWNQGALSHNMTAPPPNVGHTGGPPQAPQTPPPHLVQQNTFQFLDQSNQRIECAENGKSYLQLGTMSHNHHLPVTPVIQPKPNMVYRRPLPPFRNPMINHHQAPVRPVCDHSNCFQKKSSLCYRTQRSRMLNLSLHKLHMSRQNHEGSLRRSVLICNLLRYVEDETEKEAMQEAAQQYSSPETSPTHNAMETDHYWPPTSNSGGSIQQQPPSQQPPTSTQITEPVSQQQNTVVTSHHYTTTTQAPTTTPNHHNYPTDTYENTLKDFNTAFRQTPYSSPVHPGAGIQDIQEAAEEERGINWSSVLSLSNQSELDPLNGCYQADNLSDSGIDLGPSHSFDDIGWKLSADDVLKAFPNDENIFIGP